MNSVHSEPATFSNHNFLFFLAVNTVEYTVVTHQDEQGQ